MGIGDRQVAAETRTAGGTARHTHPTTAATEVTSGAEAAPEGREVVSTAAMRWAADTDQRTTHRSAYASPRPPHDGRGRGLT